MGESPIQPPPPAQSVIQQSELRAAMAIYQGQIELEGKSIASLKVYDLFPEPKWA